MTELNLLCSHGGRFLVILAACASGDVGRALIVLDEYTCGQKSHEEAIS